MSKHPNSTFFATSHNNDPRANDRWKITEPAQMYRKSFAKDRDRILYSKGFLRLRDKTQVFMMGDSDYIRTRLTHTLEVSQIARSIATALGLNLDLTEAIALGHDVGHTPFGHVGERTLDEFTKGTISLGIDIPEVDQGFKHNLQSARVLCQLEPGTEDSGLNLTKYTLWGIIHHSKIQKQLDDGTIIKYPYYQSIVDTLESYWSFEGYVVALADEIAQRHHDIEDSLRYKLINRDDLISSFKPLTLSGQNKKNFDNLKKAKKNGISQFIALFSRVLVNMYVVDAIIQTKKNFNILSDDFSIGSQTDFLNQRPHIDYARYSSLITLSDEMNEFDESFQKLLKDKVINSYAAQALDGKGAYIIRRLFKAYFTNPNQMQDSAIHCLFKTLGQGDDRSKIMEVIEGNKATLIRVIADYIAGMTDSFAYDQYDLLYGTRR